MPLETLLEGLLMLLNGSRNDYYARVAVRDT